MTVECNCNIQWLLHSLNCCNCSIIVFYLSIINIYYTFYFTTYIFSWCYYYYQSFHKAVNCFNLRCNAVICSDRTVSWLKLRIVKRMIWKQLYSKHHAEVCSQSNSQHSNSHVYMDTNVVWKKNESWTKSNFSSNEKVQMKMYFSIYTTNCGIEIIVEPIIVEPLLFSTRRTMTQWEQQFVFKS